MPIELYVPVPSDDHVALQLAPRLDALEGARIGLLGNLKPNCDVLLDTTAELLRSRAGVRETVRQDKASCSLGANKKTLDELAATCRAAVVGLGD